MKRIKSATAGTALTGSAATLLAVIASALLWGLAGTPTFAQKAQILVNHFEESGWRMVSTDLITCRGNGPDKCPLRFGLTCSQSPEGGRSWDLELEAGRALDFEIAYKSLMLVKLDDESVIELSNANVRMRHRENVNDPDDKTVSARYPLSEDQLEALTSHAVTKIRIATTNGPIEINYKKDKVCAALSAQLSLILSSLDSSSSDIREGF